MTQNEIDIIKREVAARLPYGLLVNYDLGNSYPYPKIGHVYLWHDNGFCGIEMVDDYRDNWNTMSRWHTARWDEIKPYLRPMDSMTDDEHEYYWGDNNFINLCDRVDWLNEYMFDYRGLIPMGLAVTAPDGMYKSWTKLVCI